MTGQPRNIHENNTKHGTHRLESADLEAETEFEEVARQLEGEKNRGKMRDKKYELSIKR